MERRNFLQKLAVGFSVTSGVFGSGFLSRVLARLVPPDYDPKGHYYGMGINIDKCIGCGSCVKACTTENAVPSDHGFYRTWVERYVIRKDEEVVVQNIDVEVNRNTDKDTLRSFFVPKLCNQCDNAPCVQVCPVGATFMTEDGVVLIDDDRCIGCSYCVQACPYGARYLHPVKQTADKCTFCYHRITQGLLPACVEVCPTQARVFGDYRGNASPLTRLKRLFKIRVLKPGLNTKPKVFYTDLDGEVR